MRTLIDEVKALKEHKEAAETVEMNQHDNIDVIVSHTLTDGARLVSQDQFYPGGPENFPFLFCLPEHRKI